MFLTRLQHRYRFPLTFLVVLGFSLFLAISSLTPSRAIPVSKIPNPRQQNSWVTDMAELLSPEGEAKLNQMITALEETNGAEMAVVTVPDTQSFASPKAFTTELFNTWGIGKKGQDNGVLVMVSKGDRRVEIETGYGVEAILPDAQVGNIIRTEILPAFKQEEYETGIVNGTLAIALDIEPEIILPKALQQKAVALLEIRKQDKIKQVKRQQERLKRNQELSLARQQRQLQLAEDKQQRLLLYQQLPIAGGILTLIGLGLFLKKAQQQLQGVQLTPTPLTTTGHPQEQHLNQGGTLQAAEIEVKSLDSTTSLFRILAGIGLALISAGVMGWVVIAWIRSWILFVLPATVVGLLLTQSLVLENIIAHIVGHLQSDLCKRFNLQSWSLKRARRHASTAQYVIPTTLLLVFLCLVFYIPFVTSTSHESSFAPDVLSAQLSAAFSLTVSLFSALAFQNLQRAFRRHLSESFFCYDCGQKS